MRVLILGGTAEARRLATQLHQRRVDFISSLAGRVADPVLPVGAVRLGGFGGVDGMVDYLNESSITQVVDATHPFAARISANAVAACSRTGTALIRLTRPGWGQRAEASTWHWVDDLDQARMVAEKLGRRPLLTIGANGLGHFTDWRNNPVVARVIDPPAGLAENWILLTGRGPYDLEHETELLSRYGIDVLVTKDSGGSSTVAKLEACARMGIPIVVVRRPADLAKTIVSGVDEVLRWLGFHPSTT